jgi:hypothetical protein
MLATTLPGAGPIGLDDPARPTEDEFGQGGAARGIKLASDRVAAVGVLELACVEHDNVGLGIPPKRTV